MPQHRKETILALIRTRLAGMTTGGGYHYDSQGAYAWMLPVADAVATPCYVVADVGEEVTHRTPTLAHRSMRVVVQALVALSPGSDPSPSLVLANVLADIETCLDGAAGRAAFEALPGFVDMRLLSTAVAGLGDVGVPLATLEAVYTVQYRTNVGAPEA